jgi:hypothetical protein
MQTYFILNTINGFIKIGKSTNVPGRLRSLQTATADRLVLWLQIEGDWEESWHRIFAANRVSGEWFDFKGDPSSQQYLCMYRAGKDKERQGLEGPQMGRMMDELLIELHHLWDTDGARAWLLANRSTDL